jgi:hypothetical protein
MTLWHNNNNNNNRGSERSSSTFRTPEIDPHCKLVHFLLSVSCAGFEFWELVVLSKDSKHGVVQGFLGKNIKVI